jgi:hypothetical protein
MVSIFTEMVKRSKIFIFLFFLVVDLYAKKLTDVVAIVDSVAITQYDLNSLSNMINYNSKSNQNDKKKVSGEVLEMYVDTLKKRAIAESNNVVLEKNERDNLWNIFSRNFNTALSIDEFCSKNKINKDTLLYFFESNYLWMKYIEHNLKRNIKVSDDDVNSYVEYLNKDSSGIKYNLSELVLFFEEKGQKTKTLNRLKNISINSDNFDVIAFSTSQSSTAKNNGLIGWLAENEINEVVFEKIKNLNKNSITEPFCIGDDSGLCFIFKVNDIKKDVNISEGEKNNVKNYIFSKSLEQKIKDTIFKYNDKINVVYK